MVGTGESIFSSLFFSFFFFFAGFHRLLLTKCVLTIHSCNNVHCTRHIRCLLVCARAGGVCVCVCRHGCGSRVPCKGGNGSTAGTRLRPHTDMRMHTRACLCVSVYVCAGTPLGQSTGGLNNNLIFHHFHYSASATERWGDGERVREVGVTEHQHQKHELNRAY